MITLKTWERKAFAGFQDLLARLSQNEYLANKSRRDVMKDLIVNREGTILFQ